MATTTTSPASTITWNLDPAHSSADFKVKHMMISNVKGTFGGLKGVLNLHETDHTLSCVRATVDISTLKTGDEQRDGHLKSPDFFDAAKYPEMVFQSTAVKRTGDGEFQ